MNIRIIELAEQAGFVYNFDPVTWMKHEKFAQLIVRECLEIVNRKEYSYHEADPLWETAELIKEHFGVKE